MLFGSTNSDIRSVAVNRFQCNEYHSDLIKKTVANQPD